VVDDEPLVRRVLQLNLQRRGFTVWLAANGREALELYERHQDRVGVVLLDVLMPELDGPQTLDGLRWLNSQVRCCFMTGDAGLYDEAELRTRGALAVFFKPYSFEDLAGVLAHLLSNPCRPG
jgi:CheY-like chemotaxis protein